jgi:hypothetical protein
MTTAATAALRRALHRFLTPNDDPSINSFSDGNFLRARRKTYVDSVRTYVLWRRMRQSFELLWPMDVGDPGVCQLLHCIELPIEWQTRAESRWTRILRRLTVRRH